MRGALQRVLAICAVAVAVLATSATLPTQAYAWNQLNSDQNVNPCATAGYGGCIRWTSGIQIPVYYSGTMANYAANLNGAIGSWNNITGAHQPKGSRTLSSPATMTIYLSSTLAAGVCGVGTPNNAGSSGTTTSANIAINANDYNNIGCPVQGTVAHEYGHAGLDIAHTRFTDALMYAYSNGVVYPNTDDINAVRGIYP